MPDEPDYILSIDGLETPDDGPPSENASGSASPWLGIHFECCDVYARVYRNRNGTAYNGHCPRCGRPIRIRVGPGGITSRFFRAT
jgi:hypothetical protein